MPILKLKNKKMNGALKPDDVPEPGLPSAADLDAVAAEEQAKQATAGTDAEKSPETSPLSTPPADAPLPEQPSAPGFAPASVSSAPSFLMPSENLNWSDPDRNTVKKDSLGNDKSDLGTFGPKGDSAPPDVQTEAQRQAAADAKEARLSQHMASTVGVDSVGHPKGRFAVTPQGHDVHGARLPDKVDLTKPIEAPPVHVGPRGRGAPTDTFHGSRPVKK